MAKTKAQIAHEEKLARLWRLAGYARRDGHIAEADALRSEAIDLAATEPQPVPRAPRTVKTRRETNPKTSFRSRDFSGAFKLHEKFREEIPKRAKAVKFDVPKVVMVMGTLESVEYTTTHKGKVHKYRHDFASGSRPFLAAGPKKNQLFIVGGCYHVTDRGIVDLDTHGKELLDPTHGEPLE